MKETVKSCSNCRYSYDLPSNRGPMAKTQYCRNKNYNSVNYTTTQCLENWHPVCYTTLTLTTSE